jgi:hypothetical protein
VNKQHTDTAHSVALSTLVTEKDIVRFWSKVKKGEGCWEWQAGKTNKGYGAFKIKGIQVYAHRVAFFLENREANMAKMFVCHHCDNPRCVRIDHLFLGTPGDNSQDRDNKHRRFRSPGERNARAIISNAQANELRDLYKQGVSGILLDDMFKISFGSVYRILRGERYVNTGHLAK